MTLSNKSTKFLLPAIVLAALAACGGGGDEIAAGETTPTHTSTGASSSTKASPPDLLFSPAEIVVAPGREINVQVRAEGQADLRGATFDLPGVQDGVTSTFEATEDSKTGVLNVAASTASAGGDVSVTVKGTSGVDASKVWAGSLRVKTTPVVAAKEIFVNPTSVGSDSGDGSPTKPFKTIGKAASMAIAGTTITLSPGSYTPLANGERYPVSVPSGVTVRGTLLSNGAQGSLLSPQTSAEQATGLSLIGDATLKDLELDVFGTAVLAKAGTQTLSNLSLILNQVGLSVSGSANATLRDSHSFIGVGPDGKAVAVTGSSQFKMEGGVIETSSQNCETSIVGISASKGATIMITGATIRNIAGSAVSLANSQGRADLNVERILPIGCKPAASIRSNNSDLKMSAGSSVVTTNGTDSIELAQVGGTMSIDATEINGGDFDRSHGAGIAVQIDSKAKLLMTRSHILGARTGLSAFFNEPGVTVTDSLFQATLLGIETTSGLKMRNTKFELTQRAVAFVGAVANGAVSADFGTAADPGNNEFFHTPDTDPNATTAVDLGNSSSGQVNAAGNLWSFGIQGADIHGQYQHGIVTGPTPPNGRKRNFNLPSVSTRIQL